MQLKNLNVRGVKALYSNPAFRVLVATLKVAREEADRLRVLVDGYCQPILDAAGLVDGKGEVITDLRRVWLCRDENATDAFYAACLKANNEAGFDLGDCCPALTADSERVAAESALLKFATEHYGMPAIYNMALRKQFLSLLLNPPRR